MNDYEIRVVRQIDNAQLVVSAKLVGDHAAICRAQILASEGDMVDVWRGGAWMLCE